MPLSKITGKVVKVFVKELDAPKTYVHNGKTITNTHRHSLQVQAEGKEPVWISFGDSKQDAFLAEDDDGKYKILGEGSEVLVKFTPNGDYKNAKKSGLTVLDFVEGTKYEPKQNNPSPQQSSSGASVNPAEVGQCLNLAVEVLKLTEEELLDPDKVVKAIQWYKRTRQLFGSLYPTVDLETSEPKASLKKDDVPFEEDDLPESEY